MPMKKGFGTDWSHWTEFLYATMILPKFISTLFFEDNFILSGVEVTSASSLAAKLQETLSTHHAVSASLPAHKPTLQIGSCLFSWWHH